MLYNAELTVVIVVLALLKKSNVCLVNYSDACFSNINSLFAVLGKGLFTVSIDILPQAPETFLLPRAFEVMC